MRRALFLALLAALTVSCGAPPGIDTSILPPEVIAALPTVNVEDPGAWTAEPYRAIVMPDEDGAGPPGYRVRAADDERAETVLQALLRLAARGAAGFHLTP